MGLFYQGYGLMLVNQAETETQGGEFQAMALFEKAIEMDPSLAESHYQLGRQLLARNRADEAVSHLQAAARLDPKQNRIHLALASAYTRLGRTREASKELSAFRDLKAEKEKGQSTLETRRETRN